MEKDLNSETQQKIYKQKNSSLNFSTQLYYHFYFHILDPSKILTGLLSGFSKTTSKPFFLIRSKVDQRV